MPPLDIEGGTLLALARAAWDGALVSLFGTLLFQAAVAPRALGSRAPAATQGGMPEREPSQHAGSADAAAWRALARLGWGSLAAAAITLPAWLWLQSAAIAGRAGAKSVAAVVTETVWGHVLLLQAACLFVLLALWPRAVRRRRFAVVAGLAAAALALQAGHGHALAQDDGPSVLLAAGVVHLLAVGGWLGGLLPLLLVVRHAPARVGGLACRWFSPLGKACVALVAASAAVQFVVLIGGIPGLLGTAYGWLACVKLALLALLFAFACLNRYWLAPPLFRPAGDASRPALVRAIAIQTGVGLLAVGAAATLASLPPSVHEQPLWPFPWRPSLAALAEPELRTAVAHGAIELSVGVALILAGLAAWRWRWAALAGVGAGLAVGAASASSLSLLLVDAYPTSFYRSPTGFAATSIVRGARLYAANCATCHGADGRGDGPAAASLPVPPADLTAAHLLEHDDGELFWWLSHGIDAPDGQVAMPGFAGTLSADDRWALIDDIRAHNAGVALREAGRWTAPVQAPSFAVTCPGRGTISTADLRGSVLHVVVPASGSPVAPVALESSPVPVVEIVLSDAPADAPACHNGDEAVRGAFAILAGLPPAAGAGGAQFLVDPNGWMRAAQLPGEAAPRWADPQALLDEVETICRHPIAAPTGGHVHH